MTIILDGTTGITTPAINSSGDLELPGGTANGVLYLNGSKVATSGSALVFDGTNLGVGTSSPATILSLGAANEILFDISAGAFPSATYDASVFICRTGSGGSAPFDQAGSLVYRTRVSSTAGRSSHIFYTGSPSVERLRINESGNVGIGTSSPGAKLDVVGSLGIRVNEDGSGTKVISIRSDFAGVGPAINVTTNDPLLFQTNNTERARITSNGNFGINTSSPTTALTVNGLFTGGFGAASTSGVTDWNDITNAYSGMGYTLLFGTDTNGPGGAHYYHVLNFEYNSKNGTGNMTQIAVPYLGGSFFWRTRYSDSWSSWTTNL